MSDANVDAGGLKRTVKDLFAGAAGGIAQVLLAYVLDFGLNRLALDIVKVRLQTTSQYSSALDGASHILKNEGPLAFYKGTLTPLVGIGACVSRVQSSFQSCHCHVRFPMGGFMSDQFNYAFPLHPLPASCVSCIKYVQKASLLLLLPFSHRIGLLHQVSIQFGAFHYARRRFETSNAARSHPINSPTLSYSQYYAAGAFAGIANSIISGPIEHVRIRLQTQPHGAHRLYSGPIDCVRKLAAHEGVLAGLYRGEIVTILREAQAYGVWFLSFEYLMNADAKRNKIKRNEIPQWKVATYGGLAGEALWLGSYPFDVVKSKMQSDGFGSNKRYASMRDCFAQTWRGEGVRGFWKGIGPTLLRAMPVSAGTFAVYVSIHGFVTFMDCGTDRQ
ncbi:MAG: hypothetical protein Q9163_001627 [Psora crenata]